MRLKDKLLRRSVSMEQKRAREGSVSATPTGASLDSMGISYAGGSPSVCIVVRINVSQDCFLLSWRVSKFQQLHHFFFVQHVQLDDKVLDSSSVKARFKHLLLQRAQSCDDVYRKNSLKASQEPLKPSPLTLTQTTKADKENSTAINDVIPHRKRKFATKKQKLVNCHYP